MSFVAPARPNFPTSRALRLGTVALTLLQAGCDDITCVDTATCVYPTAEAGAEAVDGSVSLESTAATSIGELGSSSTNGPQDSTTPDPDIESSSAGASESDADSPITPSSEGSTIGTDAAIQSSEADPTAEDAGFDASSPSTDCEDCLVCELPAVDCDGTCTDLDQDPLNCGACGRDCLGQTCSNGQCEPFAVGTLDFSPVDLTVQGGYAYALGDGAVWQLPGTGGSPVQVGSATHDLTRLITDESYHYSFYFETNIIVGRSPLVALPNGVSSFQDLTEPKVFPSPVPGFEASDSHLYVVFSANTKDLYRVAKTGGELTWISGSQNLYLNAFDVDEAFIFGISRQAIAKLSVEGGLVSPVASATAEETLNDIELTADDIVVLSDTRIATMPKTGSALTTLVELPNLYVMAADAHGASVAFVQALGDPETCSEGSVVYESTMPGTPAALATLSPGCASHIAIADDAVYWTQVDSPDVFKVTRR